MLQLLAYLIPGLPQYQRGERLIGLAFGLAAVGLVLFMYVSNRSYLYLHRDLRARAPRSLAGELWDVKREHRDRGAAAGLGLILLSALDALLGRRRAAAAAAAAAAAEPAPEPEPPGAEEAPPPDQGGSP